jgi:hypothetical protein
MLQGMQDGTRGIVRVREHFTNYSTVLLKNDKISKGAASINTMKE